MQICLHNQAPEVSVLFIFLVQTACADDELVDERLLVTRVPASQSSVKSIKKCLLLKSNQFPTPLNECLFFFAVSAAAICFAYVFFTSVALICFFCFPISDCSHKASPHFFPHMAANGFISALNRLGGFRFSVKKKKKVGQLTWLPRRRSSTRLIWRCGLLMWIIYGACLVNKQQAD